MNAPQMNTHIWDFQLYMIMSFLFLTLRNKFQEIHLDNIYMSAEFAHLSYTYQIRVKVQGVCQNGGQGIPRELFQTDFQEKKEVDQIC